MGSAGQVKQVMAEASGSVVGEVLVRKGVTVTGRSCGCALCGSGLCGMYYAHVPWPT